MMKNDLSRRAVLGSGGAVALAGGAALASASRAATTATGAPVDPAGVCFVNPDVVDGPYYEDKPIARRDITEGKQGIPLEVRVRLVDASCRPIRGARVDTWQADRGGIYSDFRNQGDDLSVATMGQTYLRGTQTTDGDGWVVFTTIYPGWYRGRTSHIHFKIYIGGHTRLTTQMFFPDTMNEFIYTRVPGYVRDLTRDTINVTDWIMAEATHASMGQMKEELDHYVATITFGVNPTATPAPSEKMPCPPAPALCVPAPGTPPVGADRIDALVPSVAARRRPKAAKPPLPPGFKPG